jgi:hypothetical protein
MIVKRLERSSEDSKKMLKIEEEKIQIALKKLEAESGKKISIEWDLSQVQAWEKLIEM